MSDDPTIRRIRASRHKISKQFHHNVAELIAHYRELEKRYSHRIVAHIPPDVHENQFTKEDIPSEVIHEMPKPRAGNF